MTFDPTKPCRTRDGRPARVICTDRKCDYYPIVALVEDGGIEGILSCMEDGRYCEKDSPSDLVNVETRDEWVNIYPRHNGLGSSGYTSKRDADNAAAPNRIACIRRTIEFTPGEGLDDG